MKITRRKLRKLIKEEFRVFLLESENITGTDKNKISSIFNAAIADIISYIKEVGTNSNTSSFRSRLNKKLEKLKLAKLTDDDIAKFEIKFKSIKLVYTSSRNSRNDDGPAAAGWWDGTDITLNTNHIYNSKGSLDTAELTKTIYHELYHGMTSSIIDVVGEQKTIEQLKFDKDSVIRAKEHRKAVYAAQEGDTPWDIPDSGNWARPAKPIDSNIDTFYELFEEEFNIIIDKRALTHPSMWRAKIKLSNNKALKRYLKDWMPGYHNKKQDDSIREVLKTLAGDEHYYVALNNLRRIFPTNTITSACNASKADISKMEYWTVMFLSVLNCSSEADSAWDRVAMKATMTDKSSDFA